MFMELGKSEADGSPADGQCSHDAAILTAPRRAAAVSEATGGGTGRRAHITSLALQLAFPNRKRNCRWYGKHGRRERIGIISDALCHLSYRTNASDPHGRKRTPPAEAWDSEIMLRHKPIQASGNLLGFVVASESNIGLKAVLSQC